MTTALDPLHGRIAVVTGGAGAIGTAIQSIARHRGGPDKPKVQVADNL